MTATKSDLSKCENRQIHTNEVGKHWLCLFYFCPELKPEVWTDMTLNFLTPQTYKFFYLKLNIKFPRGF